MDKFAWRGTSTLRGAQWKRRATLASSAGVSLLLLAGCGARPSSPGQAVALARPPGTTEFQLDTNASQIWLMLQADGPMSKIGHTHVITTHGLQGSIWLHPQADRSGCAFELPVATFVVDDPKERASAGEDYAEPLDEEARAGTREHMLGARQLDAAHYPKVHLQCQHLTGGSGEISAEMNIIIRDHASRLSVPVKWQRNGSTLQAEGEFSFTQTGLGLEPYSLLFGALKVRDEIRARFRLVARTT